MQRFFFYFHFGILLILSACNAPKYTKVKNIQKTINVKDFGATGNGITDDTHSIQNALDSAGVNKATIYFPKGTYIISRTTILENKKYCLFAQSDTNIIGESVEQTIIKLGKDHGGFARMFNIINKENIKISDLSFNGNLGEQARKEEHQGGIWINQSRNIIIKNCHFYNTGGDGIGIRGPKMSSSSILVSNCKFKDHHRNGITLGSGFNNVTIDSCHFDATSIKASPIDSEPKHGDCRNVTIKNCRVDSNKPNATIITLGGHIPVYGYKIFNNTFNNCGLHLVRAYDSEIYDNEITTKDYKRPGVKMIYGNKNINIHNNKISSVSDVIALITARKKFPAKINIYENVLSTEGKSSHGIRLQGVEEVKIENNQIRNNNKQCDVSAIFLRSTKQSTNINIRRNKLTGFNNGLKLAVYKENEISNLLFEDNELYLPPEGKAIEVQNVRNVSKELLDYSKKGNKIVVD